jgi:hypothetical protein
LRLSIAAGFDDLRELNVGTLDGRSDPRHGTSTIMCHIRPDQNPPDHAIYSKLSLR